MAPSNEERPGYYNSEIVEYKQSGMPETCLVRSICDRIEKGLKPDELPEPEQTALRRLFKRYQEAHPEMKLVQIADAKDIETVAAFVMNSVKSYDRFMGLKRGSEAGDPIHEVDDSSIHDVLTYMRERVREATTSK